jgi:hypothetical protein
MSCDEPHCNPLWLIYGPSRKLIIANSCVTSADMLRLVLNSVGLRHTADGLEFGWKFA